MKTEPDAGGIAAILVGEEFELLCARVQSGELDYASADLHALELALRAEKKA
jgi:hypothetical protein